MGSAPRIAIDAMGGDTGPAVMVAGAARAHARRGDLRFLLFGDETLDPRRSSLEHPKASPPRARSSIATTSSPATEKPSQAIRRAKTTSMGRADRRGEGGRGRGRGFGRQYRRADGDGQAGAAHHARHRPARAGRAAADARRQRPRHARSRRQHRMRRPESRPVRGDGRRLCARRARSRSGRASSCSTSAPRS